MTHALAKNRIGTFGLFMFALSSIAPMTVIALVMITGFAVTGLVAVSAAVIVVGAVLMMWAPGYVAMAGQIRNTGAFYAYISAGLGRPIGVGAAWLALGAYSAFQVATYGGVGAFASFLFTTRLGMQVPWWAVAALAWLLVFILGRREVKVSERVLAVLVITETLLVVACCIIIATSPGFHPSGAAFDFTALGVAGGGALLAMAATGAAGIEQSAALFEEARNASRSVRHATYLLIGFVTVLYAFAGWVIVSAGGPQLVQLARGENASELFFNQAAAVVGDWIVLVCSVAILTSLMAALLSFHGIIARYGFALGREGVLPRVFGKVVGGAPRNASHAQSAFGAVVIVLYAVAGWDPLVQLFFWGGTTGGVGVIVLITLVALAVVRFFGQAPDEPGEHWARRLLMRVFVPAVSACALVTICCLIAFNLTALYGSKDPADALPIVVAVLFAGGMVWALILRKTRPEVYKRIGLGALSATPASAGFASMLASTASSEDHWA